MNCFSDAKPVLSETLNVNHDGIKEDQRICTWVAHLRGGNHVKGIAAVNAAPAGAPQFIPMDSPPENGGAPEVDAAALVEWVQATVDAEDDWTHMVPLDGGGAAVVSVVVGNAATSVSLVDPSGTVWDEQAAAAQPGMHFARSENEGNLVVEVVMEAATPGMWQVSVDGSGALEDFPVSLSVRVESGLTLIDLTPREVGAAVPRPVGAWIGDPERGEDEQPALSGLSVEVDANLPNGQAQNQTLADDGQSGDGDAGDRFFAALLPTTSQSGTERLVYRGEGEIVGAEGAPGQPFRRVSIATRTLAGTSGFIVGPESFETVDIDDNGYPDAVLVQVRVESIESGDFALRGSLREDSQDATVTAVAEFTRSEAGSALVTLAFNPRELPQGVAFSSFELSQLSLTRQGDDPVWLDATNPEFPVPVTLFNPISRYLRLAGNLDFGTLRVGESVTRTLEIHNDGWEPLSVAGLSLPAGFSGNYEGRVDPGAPVEVEIKFDATEVSEIQALVDVDSDSHAGETQHPLYVTVSPSGVDFNDWLIDKGVPIDQRGPLDDPNTDGIVNLLAFLFNIAPVGESGGDLASALPRSIVGEDENGRYLALRYRHHRDAVNLKVTLMASPDLTAESWQPVVPETIHHVGIDPETGDDIKEYRVEFSALEYKNFLRLKVEE